MSGCVLSRVDPNGHSYSVRNHSLLGSLEQGPNTNPLRGDGSGRSMEPPPHARWPMTDLDVSLMRGTLDLLILKALSWGPRHGYGVVEWIGQATDATLLVGEGTLYPALHRLERQGLVESE